MNTCLNPSITDYTISFGLETIDSIQVEAFKRFFADLPVDPYIKGKYRQRRLSRVRVSEDGVESLPNGYFCQSKNYNPMLGDVQRQFAPIDRQLIALHEFEKLVFEFCDRCKISPGGDIDVHQIRTTCSPNTFGNPAPEGIHRDGADFIGIFAKYSVSASNFTFFD